MNKDKAIQLLERLQDPEPYEPMLTKDAYDAIQMAIDALSADGDTISRKAAIEVIDSFNVFDSRSDQIKLEQMIGELPPAQPKNGVIEQIKWERDVAIEQLKKLGYGLGEKIRAEKDCISRQAAIEAIDEQIKQCDRALAQFDITMKDEFAVKVERASLCAYREQLEELPPAQPEIIYCKDCKKHNKHYHESPYKDTVCPLTAWRGKARGHEYDYQYCCYAERKEVTE